jgi:hypothetical protein
MKKFLLPIEQNRCQPVTSKTTFDGMMRKEDDFFGQFRNAGFFDAA